MDSSAFNHMPPGWGRPFLLLFILGIVAGVLLGALIGWGLWA